MELDKEHLKSKIFLQKRSSHKCQSFTEVSATTNLSILKGPEEI